MPVTAPDEDLLRRLPMFRRVSAELRARISAVARIRRYDKGELIFAEGDVAHAFIVIVTGRIKVFKSTPAGKEIILEIFGDGDPLGAVAVYEGAPFMASALAIEPSELLIVDQRDFLRMLEEHPAFVRGLLSGLTIRLAELTRRLAELTGARVEARFARLFLKLCEQLGRQSPDGLFIAMPLSRQELADLTGTTIETAIRIMSRWQKDDVLLTEKNGFMVVDRQALESAAAG